MLNEKTQKYNDAHEFLMEVTIVQKVSSNFHVVRGVNGSLETKYHIISSILGSLLCGVHLLLLPTPLF